MFKNSKKILISKHFLISLLFIIFIFTSVGVSLDNVSASDLNMEDVGIKSELNIEDKLENSHYEKFNIEVESADSLGISQGDNILGKNIPVSGKTFSDIRNALKNANDGDVIKLSGTYKAEKKYDSITVNKRVTFISDSMATLDGKGLSRIMFLNTSAAGSSLKNIKFVNGYTDGLAGGIRIETKNIEITNCIFEDNEALRDAAISTIGTNGDITKNLKITNCLFINNHALISGGALSAHGDKSIINNCTFDSNSAYGDPGGKTPFGGAIQVGLDDFVSRVSVLNCIFENNHVDSDRSTAHGGAGCVRNGTIYQNCIFINNSASQGGALTYHASGLIKNCTFIDNLARLYGGALSTGYADSSMDLSVVDCKFERNVAPIGGAVQLIGKNINVDNCYFDSNNASKYGGAICIDANTVKINDSSFNNNVANIYGGAILINGSNTIIGNSSFVSNDAIPDINKLDDGLGGAIYINSTYALVQNNEFYHNTARNGSAIYNDESGVDLKVVNNTLYQNQAWVYALPVCAEDIYYGESEKIASVIHGGNNIGKYGDLSISNAIYNAANNNNIKIDGETPIIGANDKGKLYQDDCEYNMDILLTVEHEDGSVVYNKTLNSNCFGEVSDILNNLKVGKYYVTAKHFEDTYYKSITNSTSFTVTAQADEKVRKSVSPEVINYDDIVIWTLNITNNGPSNATNVVVRDILPEGLIWLEDNTNGDYNPQTGTLTIDFLEVGEIYIVTIKTQVIKTGEIVNDADVRAEEHDYNLTNNHDQSKIDVASAADLAIEKTVNASVANMGNLVRWTITVTNNGPDMATGVKVSDVLPQSLIWESDDSNGRYDVNAGVWDIGTLANGANAKLNIVCRVNATGVIENVVSVTGEQYDWNISNNYAREIINVSPACDLSVIKVVSDSVVNYGDVVRWTVSVSNNGPDGATGVKIYDALPEGFVILNSTRPYADGVIDIGDLSVGESVKVDIHTRVNVTGSFVNVASVKGNEHDYNLDNNEANASIFVKPASDLIVTKNVNESRPNYLDLVKWTIKVHNRGINAATGVKVIEVLPQSLLWVSDDSNGDYDTETGIWNVGSVGVGESKTLTIVTLVNATGEFANIVSVSGNEFDWNKSNNLDNESINVANATDLEIIKMVNQSVVDYHQSVKWTVVAINHGPDKATGVYVEDVLPEGFKLINYTASKGFYDNGMWSVCCIESGESQTLELICEVVKTGEFTNVAIINGSEYDPKKTNNRDNVTVTVPKSSDLAIIKTVDNHYPDYGDIVEWTITLVNNGPDDCDDIQVIESLPDGLELISYRCSAGSYFEDVWEIDHLANGASECLVLRCMVNALDEIENIVKVIPSQHDWNESNNNDSEKISSSPVADLSIVKFANVSQANYLDLVKWTLIVTNNGVNDATGVFVSDVIPRGLEVIDVIGGSYENAIWDIGDLKSGQSRELEIICKIKATGKFSNVAFVWAQETDPDLSNNEVEDSFYVPPASDISITKTVSKYKYNVGDLVRYVIKITNNGPDSASGIKVQEIMDDSLLLKSVHASAGEFDKINDVWSLDELDVGEFEFLKISAIAKKAGIAENKVVATSDNFDHDLDNNDDSVSINVSEKDKPVKVTKESKKHSDEYHKQYSASILQKYPSGNPVMVLVLLFVFSLGAIYGNNILKKR